MNPKQAIELLKQCATLVQCDYDARVKLIEAIKVLEGLLPKEKE